jgi:hypothetical protein
MMAAHTLTIGKIKGAIGKRSLVATCSCGVPYTIHEGSARTFEAEAPRRAHDWHRTHLIASRRTA